MAILAGRHSASDATKGSEMQRVFLGDSGAEVSALCLGCMFFGTQVDEQTAFRLLDRYFDAGGRFLDTANNYAFWVDGGQGGESESLLGRWLERRGKRDDVFLATKVGANPTVAGGGLESAEGLSAGAIRRAVDASLRRLGTDYIDLYYAHIDDRATPLEETLAAFGELVAAGKVRYVGCSNMTAWRIERARRLADGHGVPSYCCVQQRHSYLRPKPGADLGAQLVAGDELLDYCAANDDVALLAYSPLLGGAYTRTDRPLPAAYVGPDSDARVAALREVATAVGATPNQVVLAWLRASTGGAIPLIAASTEAQLAENLAALDFDLGERELRHLTAAGA
jgi:aryl-alcohol dehydrogenase-like predicted oxidoreductase